tara:strand:+ start:385 stop:576 length:192 start_codon:yes stop_codon:yes gene_type:complete
MYINKEQRELFMELISREYWEQSEKHNCCFVDNDPDYHDFLQELHRKLANTTFGNGSLYWGML